MWVPALNAEHRTVEHTVRQPRLFVHISLESSKHQWRSPLKSLNQFQTGTNHFTLSMSSLIPNASSNCSSPLDQQLQGHSRHSSPSGVRFNPDQMLIRLFGCWPSAWAAGQLWQAVPSCAVSLPKSQLPRDHFITRGHFTANWHVLWTDSMVANAINLIYSTFSGPACPSLTHSPWKNHFTGFFSSRAWLSLMQLTFIYQS